MAMAGSGRTNNPATWAPKGSAAEIALARTASSRGPPVNGARILTKDMTSSNPAGDILIRTRNMAKQTQNRAWQRMLSGRRLDLLDPSPLDVEIEDMAHGLARVARWNGQTKGAHIFSVAQHTL